MREDYEGYREEFRIWFALVSFGSLPRGKVFVVDAEGGAAHSAARLPGYLARPQERYNGDTKDLKQGLAIRRFVDFVNVGGAPRFRRVLLVDGPL